MRKLIWTHVSIIVMLVLVACSSPEQFAATPQVVDQNTEIVEASWVVSFTLDDLVATADLVIEGSVASIRDTRFENQIPNVFAGEIHTDYNVSVSKILKAYPGFNSQTVVVKHRGGTLQGRSQVVREDEPFPIGQKVLLFLRDISIYPGQAGVGETKYSVLMPGGRFYIRTDGKLDTPTQHLQVADAYRGKEISTLEQDVLKRIPAPSDYLQWAVQGSFLIVEGTVGQALKTYMSTDATAQERAELKARGQLPDQVYTFYSFNVSKVLEDKLAGAAEYPHKTALYKGIPVMAGSVITVVEMGGTVDGITQRRTLVPFLKPGDQMLLFLGGIGCGDGLPICTQPEQQANKVLYMIGDLSDRFLIGSDNRLVALTPGPVSRSYNGQLRNRLEQDIAVAKVNLQKALDQQKMQPTPVPPAFPPPPSPTPRR